MLHQLVHHPRFAFEQAIAAAAHQAGGAARFRQGCFCFWISATIENSHARFDDGGRLEFVISRNLFIGSLYGLELKKCPAYGGHA